MIPLICIDVDGTLVGSSGQVSDAVWSSVDSALNRGQHLALSTARGAFATSWEIAQRLDPNGWHVFHAGGAVVHASTRETRAHSLSEVQVGAAEKLGSENSWVTEIYSAADYVVDSDQPLAVDHAGLIGVAHRRRTRRSLDTPNEIVRIQFVVPAAETAEAVAAAESIGLTATSATSPIMPGAAFVSLTMPGISKATGVAAVADQLGIAMDDVMMVGDGLNDLPALEVVGHPVAMGNAGSAVVAAAAHVVADVESDGVVEALELSASLPTPDVRTFGHFVQK